jgi:NADH:ubiquinone oxidoreductase subunit F (NADH-binding)
MTQGEATEKDITLLQSVANQINGKTLCAFGDAAATPVLTTLKVVQAGVRSVCEGQSARAGRLSRAQAR